MASSSTLVLVASTAITHLRVDLVSSVRPCSETTSGGLVSAIIRVQSRPTSLQFQNQRINSVVSSTRMLVCASASSAAAPTEGNITKSLEGIQVYDPAGAKLSLTSLWENRKAVVAFARHFGCILCRKKAALLEARKAEFDAAEVALVLIAPGLPEQAKIFLENNNFTGEVYADPDYASYEALDVAKGVFSIINPKSGQRVLQAFFDGWRQDWKLSSYSDTIQSGAWLQGGILVAGPGKDHVHYFFKDGEAGDEPNMNDLMSACCDTPVAT